MLAIGVVTALVFPVPEEIARSRRVAIEMPEEEMMNGVLECLPVPSVAFQFQGRQEEGRPRTERSFR